MSLEIEHISKTYGSRRVLNDVSFSLHSGEIVGFLGPNGAGKSTLMKIITGYVTPDSGTVRVSGITSGPDSLEAKQLIGYLPEHNPLYLDMYVREYLDFAADFYQVKNKRQRIEEMIARTGLTPESHKKIGQLSKGYRQRVGLAQALIHDPQVLILDEPTTGLDPNQLIEIRQLIAEVGKEKTVLFSTHIMQEVQALCERVVIINHGNIVVDSPVDTIAARMGDGFTFELQFAQPTDIDTIKRLVDGKITYVNQTAPDTFQIEASDDIRQALFRNAADAGLTIITLHKVEHTMEELFKQFTKA
ncbi:MAG: gliding motility-associated ABC transporter ATP-binding subunit GldA [Bacteroidales bacterium]|nr:gliding motility-associated ABC transporter ATP-binding subunit GldA [Bacteroidales bacterium]